MLYGNESISHYTPSNIAVWMTMSFQAGLLNIGGFIACHRFVSHVTGFPTFFGYEMAKAHYDQALGMLLVPAFFLLGAMISGQLVDIRLKLHKKPKYYISFGVIFFLNFAVFTGGILGLFGGFAETSNILHNYVLLGLLCLACGIQNGTITSVSQSVIRTTHLTGLTTDLGIGIVRVLNKRNLSGEMSSEFRANLMRIGIIFSFFCGSVIGAYVFFGFEYLGFLLPTLTSGILFVITFYYQVLKNHSAKK